MATKTPLSSDDWVKAAFRALSTGGVQAIRAEAIARDLKVSKGSFYWHFRDVPDLKAQMLEHWAAQATDAIIADVEANDGSGREQLRLLVEAATGDRNLAYGGVQAEGAIREWARYDDAAAAVLKVVDQRRLAYVARLFERCGFFAASSRSGANILYGALIGLEALASGELADLRTDMLALLSALLERGGDQGA
ncbi:TetR/AcrR family transcriptional regulator [Ensifer sp. 4252]|uniref:TetR/AcrR family transcriptional regulator n=1 Tax=Ensifer sp. 4252 TaxID=3373915 RepID=UPI003D1AFEAE